MITCSHAHGTRDTCYDGLSGGATAIGQTVGARIFFLLTSW